MTLTPEQLREACAAAGVETRSETGEHFTANVDGAWLFHANKGVSLFVLDRLIEKLLIIAVDDELPWDTFCDSFDVNHIIDYLETSIAVRITAAMRALTGNQEWGGGPPKPTGGIISRREELREHCVYYSRAEDKG